MSPDHPLPPGQPLSLRLSAGDELMCTAGMLHLTTLGPWLGQAWPPPVQALPAGQSWRASENLWVQLQGVGRKTRYRLMPAPSAAQPRKKSDTGGHEAHPHPPASARSLGSGHPARAA